MIASRLDSYHSGRLQSVVYLCYHSPLGDKSSTVPTGKASAQGPTLSDVTIKPEDHWVHVVKGGGTVHGRLYILRLIWLRLSSLGFAEICKKFHFRV